MPAVIKRLKEKGDPFRQMRHLVNDDSFQTSFTSACRTCYQLIKWTYAVIKRYTYSLERKKGMTILTAHSIRNIALMFLCLTAGIVDVIGYLSLGHVFTANMTGNIVLLGIAAGSSLQLNRSSFHHGT